MVLFWQIYQYNNIGSTEICYIDITFLFKLLERREKKNPKNHDRIIGYLYGGRRKTWLLSHPNNIEECQKYYAEWKESNTNKVPVVWFNLKWYSMIDQLS